MSKGNKGFGSMFTEGLDNEAELDNASPSEGIMASRSQTLARIASGKTVTDRTEWVDPARCRPWRMHNRDLDHLSEESCRDLIDSFLAAKRQRIPAIVRRLKDDPDYDYEIIAGVRRWWIANGPGDRPVCIEGRCTRNQTDFYFGDDGHRDAYVI